MPQTMAMHSCELPEKYINQLHIFAKFGTKHGHWYILMMDCEGIKC